MKQILQSLSSGQTSVEEIPVPQNKQGELLIHSHCTLISAGTERMLLDFGKAGIIGKIKQQPDKVKEVLEKVKTDGLFTTLDAVKAKLDQPVPLGYCNVGHVIGTGGVLGFKEGDRVLSNGSHAAVVRVPKNLCVRIPNEVPDEHAVFAVLGAIALQGIRLVQPTLGECIVVQGLGLIGLMAVQLLIANGCRVLGVDFDKKKCELARSFGAEAVDLSAGGDLISCAHGFSRGRGVDAVLITASATSDEIVHQAASICRQRGRIVLVGVVGLNLRRDDFYKKELSFQVSCSYGPGRYDKAYEEQGQDYPLSHVRWTEQRNFEAVLDMMAAGKLDVSSLISQQFDIEDAAKAYATLDDRSNLGVLLNYPKDPCDYKANRLVSLSAQSAIKRKGAMPIVAFVGAGNYASRMLMPAFKASGASLDTVITNQGVSGVIHGKKQGFCKAGTDFEALLDDDAVNTVVIATRHDLHAQQAIAALKAGKHVFVEKPLAIKVEALEEIKKTYESLDIKPLLMLGFNRRFSPQIQKIKQLLSPVNSPKNFVMTVNAGFIPADHWTQDPDIGGGRLVGEACHFVDLLRYLAGAEIVDANVSCLSELPEGVQQDENTVITLRFLDGSQGCIQYFANGHKAVPKERLEVFVEGKVLKLDNFRKLRGYGFSRFKKMNLWRQDKGQKACVAAFVKAIQYGESSPIAWQEMIEVTQVCLDLKEKIENMRG